MKEVLLDTHAFAWSLNGDAKLSDVARRTLENAEAVFMSPICFFEIGQKVRLGKWPQMEPFVADLPAIYERQGGFIASMTGQICLDASLLGWDHRDPFDRIIAATANKMSIPLISCDTMFDTLKIKGKSIHRIW